MSVFGLEAEATSGLTDSTLEDLECVIGIVARIGDELVGADQDQLRLIFFAAVSGSVSDHLQRNTVLLCCARE